MPCDRRDILCTIEVIQTISDARQADDQDSVASVSQHLRDLDDAPCSEAGGEEWGGRMRELQRTMKRTIKTQTLEHQASGGRCAFVDLWVSG